MKKKIFGIPALALVLGLLVVGGATAALLSYFGTLEVTADVEQAVTVDGEEEIDLGVVTGPLTHNELLTVKNNNDERAVSYTWEELSSSQAGTMLGVYEVSEYNLIGQKYGNTNSFETNYFVKVIPGVETVTYKIDFPENATEFDLQISREDLSNYHVKFDGEDFLVFEPSKNHGGDAIVSDEFLDFVSGLTNDNSVEIVVKKDIGYEQSFMVQLMGDFDEFDSAVTPTAFEQDNGNGDWYQDNSQDYNNIPNQDNLLGTERTINPSAGNDYVFSVFVDTNFEGELLSKVGVKPVTQI